MLYAAKCYWPGVTEADLEQVADRAASTGLDLGTGTVTYLGCLLFAADDLVLCLFQGPSRAAVIQASDPARHPPRTAHGLGLARPTPAQPGRNTEMINSLVVRGLFPHSVLIAEPGGTSHADSLSGSK